MPIRGQGLVWQTHGIYLRIIYVSCNPATLARDLKILADLKYIPQEIQPVDMLLSR